MFHRSSPQSSTKYIHSSQTKHNQRDVRNGKQTRRGARRATRRATRRGKGKRKNNKTRNMKKNKDQAQPPSPKTTIPCTYAHKSPNKPKPKRTRFAREFQNTGSGSGRQGQITVCMCGRSSLRALTTRLPSAKSVLSCMYAVLYVCMYVCMYVSIRLIVHPVPVVW